MPFPIIYSQTSREKIRSLHPDIKALVKEKIKQLKEDPFQGKALVKDLSGYYSLRTRRYPIIYKIMTEQNIVQIHYVGHRKDIYETLRPLETKKLFGKME